MNDPLEQRVLDAIMPIFHDVVRELDENPLRVVWNESVSEPSAATMAGRCPSCHHETTYHQPEGCWFTVTHSREGKDSVCPCKVPAEYVNLNPTPPGFEPNPLYVRRDSLPSYAYHTRCGRKFSEHVLNAEGATVCP